MEQGVKRWGDGCQRDWGASLEEAMLDVTVYPDALREEHSSPQWKCSRAERANLHLTQEAG